MADQEMVNEIRIEASKNPTLNDMLLDFATRERARSSLKLQALVFRMKQAKFDHKPEDYAAALQFLAKCGVGHPVIDGRKGYVKELRNIRIALPALGQAVLGEGALKNVKTKRPYHKMVVREQRKPRAYQSESKLVLTVVNGDSTVNIPIPKTMPSGDVAKLIEKFQKD